MWSFGVCILLFVTFIDWQSKKFSFVEMHAAGGWIWAAVPERCYINKVLLTYLLVFLVESWMLDSKVNMVWRASVFVSADLLFCCSLFVGLTPWLPRLLCVSVFLVKYHVDTKWSLGHKYISPLWLHRVPPPCALLCECCLIFFPDQRADAALRESI